MGMGLSITRNVLQAMGGTIDVEYSSPKGTTFAVTLQPYAGEEEAVSEFIAVAEGHSEDKDSRLNVFVIDDEERVLRYLENALAHHVVSVESDGRRAIDRIASGDYDIVLCDLMMPKMSGREIHAELQEKYPDAAERMLFMTGGVFAEELASFLEELPGRWVEKPIDFGELESKIWSRIEALASAKRSKSEPDSPAGA